MADKTVPVVGAFGSEPLAVSPMSEPGVPGGDAVKLDGPAVPLNDVAMAGEPRFDGARAARDAEATRPIASKLETIGAGIMSWDTTRMVQRLARPAFDDDTPINQFEYKENLPLHLTPDEDEYFTEVAKGEKSAAYAVEQIQNRRRAAGALGDNPITGLAASFVDPVWLVIPPAIKVGRLSPVAGRSAAAGVGAALGGAVTAAGEGPISDEEIALNMMFNAAGAAVFYRPGKGLQKADPEFPEERLNAAVEAVQAGAAGKPKVRLVQPEKWEEVDIPEQPAKWDWQAIESPELNSSKPGYNFGNKKFAVEFESPIDKAAYIVGGKGKSAKHDAILDWAVQTSGMSAAELIKRGDEIRKTLRAQARVAEDGSTLKRGATEPYKPRMKAVLREAAQPARKERRKVQDAVFEEVPESLRPGAVLTEPAKVAADVETAIKQDSRSRGVADKLQWNMYKTLAGMGPVGKRIADLLLDNNSDLSVHSVEAHRESVLNPLKQFAIKYEDALRQAMAEDGYGLMKQINPFTAREYYARQLALEKKVHAELMRRDQLNRIGVEITKEGVNPRVAALADRVGEVHKAALKEQKAAGVLGADNIMENPGYLSRRWSSHSIDTVESKLTSIGLSPEQARLKIRNLVSLSLRRANTFDKATADSIATAILDRARSRGYFEEGPVNAAASAEDAGKAGHLQRRMDLDYRAMIRVGDENVSIMDLIDSRVTNIMDQYIQRAATTTAFARKGIKSPSDIQALRKEFLESRGPEDRRAAKELFDNIMAHFRGEPAGAAVNENFRLMQAYGRMITLAWSAFWQGTEYATAMGEFGLRKTLKYATQEIPGFKQVMQSKDRQDMGSLNNVLAEHSVASIRMRPYINRFEDGFEMDTGSAMQLSAQTLGQMVPFANGMRYVHHHQAKMVGNLVLDRLDMAAKGNVKAREALAKYGLEAPVMDKLAQEIKTHGFKVDDWSDAVWADVRPALHKMMDASVLKGRLGDVPAFAAFDQVGKFIFTYRTFVLTAHNKVLAGNMARNGAGAVGLVLMYQFPLAMAAVQAQATLRGEGTLSTDDLVAQALGQMGGMGLFSEPLKWASGQSNAVGSPGLIPVDRAIKGTQGLLQGDLEKAGSTALTMLPVFSAVPFVNGISHIMKE